MDSYDIGLYNDILEQFIYKLNIIDSSSINSKITIYINPYKTSVYSTKLIIQNFYKIRVANQVLIFNGERMSDNFMVADYNIYSSNKIYIITTLSPNEPIAITLPLKYMFSDVNVITYDEPLIRSSLKGRNITNGINIELQCTCTKDYRVIYPLGIDTFDIIYDRDKILCPLCNKQQDPVTLALTNCSYKICGTRYNRDKYTSHWIRVTNTYRIFNTEECSKARWIKLLIESRD